MSSTAKALTLFSHFSVEKPEIGLSELCTLANRDKATTYRHLRALESEGFIEQNPVTKNYRIGPAVLRLSQIREATVPRKEGAMPALRTLSDTTWETAHVTVLSGSSLYGLCESESPRHGIRAVIDLDTFPLHATASGLCALAFGPSKLFQVALQELTRFTDKTPTSADQLMQLVDTVRETGFGSADQSYEAEINSLAAPVFDQSGLFAGAVAVASVATRFTVELEAKIQSNLVTAAHQISRNWGGSIPTHIEEAWTQSIGASKILEPTQ